MIYFAYIFAFLFCLVLLFFDLKSDGKSGENEEGKQKNPSFPPQRKEYHFYVKFVINPVILFSPLIHTYKSESK